jgi:hypothetical protein
MNAEEYDLVILGKAFGKPPPPLNKKKAKAK